MAGNGWNEWSKHVLAELERLNNLCEKLDDKYDDFTIKTTKDISWLKAKSGFYGLIGGLIPATVAVIIAVMKYL